VGGGTDDGSMVLLARGESRSSSLPSQLCRSSTSLRLLLVFLAGGKAISGDAIGGWCSGRR
jgi:hypothetical protein